MGAKVYLRVVYDGGRIVTEEVENGGVIDYRGTNPETRYWPPNLTWWDRLMLRVLRRLAKWTRSQ